MLLRGTKVTVAFGVGTVERITFKTTINNNVKQTYSAQIC